MNSLEGRCSKYEPLCSCQGVLPADSHIFNNYFVSLSVVGNEAVFLALMDYVGVREP